MSKNKNLLFNKPKPKQKPKPTDRKDESMNSERDNTGNNSSRILKTSASVRLLTVNLNATNKKSSVVKKLNLDMLKKNQKSQWNS